MTAAEHAMLVVDLEEQGSRDLALETLLNASSCDHEALGARLLGLVDCSPAWGGKVRLRAGATVGEHAIGRLIVRVRPRLGVGDLVNLFARAQRRVGFHIDPQPLGAGLEEASSFREALAAALVMRTERLLAGDLDRTYRHREERLVLLRGRPRFDAIGGSPAALGVPCRFVEGTRDTVLNRLCAAGLRVAVRALAPSKGWLRRARAAAQAFAELAPRAHTAEAADFTLARESLGPRTELYRTALCLSEWLVLGGGPLTAEGSDGHTGWRLDMAALFEATVERCLEAELRGSDLRVLAQHEDRRTILNGFGAVYTRTFPDIEIWRRDDLVAIVDAKYKDYAAGHPDGRPRVRVSNDDIYQLAFYGSRQRGARVPLAVVSPAAPKGACLAEGWRTVHLPNGASLRVVALDLVAAAAGRSNLCAQILADADQPENSP